MFAIKSIRGPWGLRVERDGELEGLDIFEHGTPAYHMEFGQGMTYTTLIGASKTPVSSDVMKKKPVSINKESV
jgi:hypothetical protein